MDTIRTAQVAALPVRGKPGSYEVLLITSRETGRWVIPKGWPMNGKKDRDAAAQEALEEAGVSGRVHRHPMGAYTYLKRREDGSLSIRVMVYLLEIQIVRRRWPERHQRTRKWMTAEAAALLVDETGLADILLRLNAWQDSRRSERLAG